MFNPAPKYPFSPDSYHLFFQYKIVLTSHALKKYFFQYSPELFKKRGAK